MGFDPHSLALAENLRQWIDNGLAYLYAPGVAKARQAVKAPPKAAQRPPARPASKAQPKPVRPAQHRARETPRSPVVHTGAWPAPWDSHISRIQPNCQAIWTYWDLCHDFGDNPDPERRALWARLIEALKWPKGSVGFLPVSECVASADVARAPLFWRGLQEIRPDHVVLFGRRAFMTLFPERSYGYKRIKAFGFKFFVFPSPRELVEGNVAAKKLVWTTLTSIKLPS